MMRALVLAVFVVSCSDPAAPPGESELPTFAAGIHALRGIGAELPDDDLEPFASVVNDATVVALGESTHTSGGYYAAKARLIRYMVRDLGFRVVLWETPWREAFPATEYVRSCTGSPDAAVGSLFPVWNDGNVRELLRWLCQWNQAHPADPVQFHGFDIQEPWKNAPALRAFVQAAAPSETARAAALDNCLGATYEDWSFFLSQEWQDLQAGIRNQPKHDACLGGIAAMEGWITNNAATLTAATTARALEEARLDLIALRAWEGALYLGEPGGYESRDFGMAQLVQRIPALYAPGKKSVVWAWNWHIARRYEEVRGWNENPEELLPRHTARSMGSFLRENLGGAYVPIALIGYRVECTSCVGPPPLEANALSLERRLHDLDWPTILVDLRQPVTLFPSGETYRISQEWGDPYRQFEAVVFLDHSPPMSSLPIP